MNRKLVLAFVLLLLQVSYSLSVTDIYSKLFGLVLGSYNFKDPNSCPATTLPSTNKTLSLNDPYGFLGLSFIAVIASFFLSMIFFMIAKALGHPQATTILTTKISDLLLVIIILLAFSSLYEVAYLPTDSILDKYHRYAFEYNGEVINKIAESYPVLYVSNSYYYAIYNFQLPVTTSKNNIFGFHLNIGPVIKPLIDLASTISTFLGIVMGEFIGRYFFLCFVRNSLLNFLLPLGFLLRMFNATKGAGATLIALAISFFSVYPMMLSLNYAIYKIHINIMDSFGRVDTVKNVLNLLGGATLGGVMVFVLSIIYRIRNVAIAGFTPLVQNVIIVTLGSASLLTLIAMLKLYEELAIIMAVYGFLLPAINIFITLNVAREISRALAVDLDLSAFMKII